MKKLLISLLLCLLPCTSIAGDLTKTDLVLEGVHLTISVADLLQTRYIARHPLEFDETNTLLGRRPSLDSITNFFVVRSIIHGGITYALRKLDAPEAVVKVWQVVSICDAGYYVVNNYNMGVKLSF
jgi:hypothetical protein